MNIVLTGFMMAGKTTIAKELSRRTGRRVIDTDEAIVRREGMSINEIFAQKGEEYFRSKEASVIAEIAGNDGAIISTGGGVVLNKTNIENLRENGVIVNIKITPEVIEERLERARANRPLIKFADIDSVLKRLAAREEFYADCDYTITASNEKTAGEQAELIIKILKENGEI